ncbi:esterase/lipase family protein [Bacillus gaemokensis]|uniref:triacylglycerol lipase n=1 Tax=Bacillus gaemokensis TaxID=574375 RepID=A0A073K489_9BACI|nr:lipase [Bacillus gaemokensis]KEK22109.1 lipase [Bacillus gaemokensis]KYG35530.1 lipase [Bacillus gaemokensis]
MKRFLYGVLSILFIINLFWKPIKSKAVEQSLKDPIILIHGLAGWGRDELLGFKYWGGFKDIEANLNQQGYRTFTASVGPFSSNWDRAVELYAYIKGGTVDYGAAHAKKHGHARYGRTYPGIYSQWSDDNNLHFVGHSMGGQTERVLVQLLKEGSREEKDYATQHPEEGVSSLFEGNKNWVRSVTSIGSPHNGSTFADKENMASFLKTFILKIASLSGSNPETFVYDFKLDQWGLKRKPGERFLQYADRMLNSSVWESKDISAYDLTTAGSKELNQWVKTFDDVYYFSYTGDATYSSLLTGHALPLLTMNPLMYTSSLHIGKYTRDNQEPFITKNWWPNDGLVSVISSQYPHGHPNQAYTGNAKKGVWNYTATKKNWDHIDFIGIDLEDTLGIRNIYSFYNDIIANLMRISVN